ncbi:MAG TPA: hypothetical protein VF228_19945 [Iamia sp.]
MARHRTTVWVLVALVASTLACSDGGGGDDAPDHERALQIVVTPAVALADAPLDVTIEGLPADTEATITVTSTDDTGRRWTDEAELRGDATQALADLLTTLHPDDGEDGLYAWGDDARTFTVAVTGEGGAGAETQVERHLAGEGVQGRPTTLEDEGFVGHLWSPAEVPAEPVAAMVLIGGSEGGLGGGPEAPLLASHGYAALELGLFKLPGLPDDLDSVPLETVADALRWLGQQPGVDPDRLWLRGASRGSEAALLVGAHFPELVAGVVATVPSSNVNCALPGCDGPAWTLGGEPLPYARPPEPAPPDAAIPVELIDGPVHTTCGEQDALWPSCAYVDAIVARRGRQPDDVHSRRATASHRVGFIAPQVVVGTIPGYDDGGLLADEQVRLEAWPALLAALAA